jgi:hypothetical protein
VKKLEQRGFSRTQAEGITGALITQGALVIAVIDAPRFQKPCPTRLS